MSESVMIYSVPSDSLNVWMALGSSRADAEHWYAAAVASGFPRPVYRIIATRRETVGEAA